MIVLHTVFSIALTVIIILSVRISMIELVTRSEQQECRLALGLLLADAERARDQAGGIRFGVYSNAPSEIQPGIVQEARESPGTIFSGRDTEDRPIAVVLRQPDNQFVVARLLKSAGHEAITRMYILLGTAMLGVYGLIALMLEVFVLPSQVYLPIERLRQADLAVQEGRQDAELIPESEVPNDELGEIMRSRNRSILKLRAQERELNAALAEVESVASELKRKNHMLETAKRNLADQDRLASLGMLSAGIAHELNTPLAVLKGSMQQFEEQGLPEAQRPRLELIKRVIGRLERLGESLLDFARAREPSRTPLRLREIVEESWTLVSLDRDARAVGFTNSLTDDIDGQVLGDPDRLTQVFVNLLRNAVDALDTGNGPDGSIRVSHEIVQRDGARWICIRITDDGPGIDPAILPRLFEPFSSTRLDSHGTGLGLAVAEGIIKEHAGVLIAGNRPGPDTGAIFEIMLPMAEAGLFAAEKPADPEKGNRP
ncbi:MAG: sensor histidine kinase [Phycisphaerales bacterium JB065]